VAWAEGEDWEEGVAWEAVGEREAQEADREGERVPDMEKDSVEEPVREVRNVAREVGDRE